MASKEHLTGASFAFGQQSSAAVSRKIPQRPLLVEKFSFLAQGVSNLGRKDP
jgi:hypothetical protein